MALWAGMTINTNESATVFNKVANLKAIPMVVKKNFTIKAMLGRSEVKHTPLGPAAAFKRLMGTDSVTGRKVEVTLLGKLPTPTTVSDGSSEVATATLNYTSDYWGAAEFDMFHYSYKHPVPGSEFVRFRGDELKTVNYLSKVQDLIANAYEKVWGTALWTSAAPSRTVFGGIPYAINDSNTYGLVDRSDSGNADFRGIVNAALGNTTIPGLRLHQNQAIANGGSPDVAITGTTLYTKIQGLVDAYTFVENDEEWNSFGGDYFKVGKIRYGLDSYCPSGAIALLTSSTWQMRLAEDPFSPTGLVYDPSRVSSWVIPTERWGQVICECPSHNVYLTAAT